MPALLLIGPAVAVIGLVAVIFVMRHKSVEKRSMYSARRSQIEHKVRAARQRTLAPMRRAEKGSRATVEEPTAPAAPTLTYETSAYAPPPVAPPPRKTHGTQPAWDTGPTAAPPSGTPTFAPTPAPPAPAYEPAPYEEPAPQPVWTPAPAEPAQPEPAAPAQAVPQTTSAGAGASWSVVGETKGTAEPEPATKKKRSKADAISAATGAWQLASGDVAGSEEADEGPRKPTAFIAIAQYAVLVVGLVMVLIGVVVMVANSKVT